MVGMPLSTYPALAVRRKAGREKGKLGTSCWLATRGFLDFPTPLS